MKDSQLASGHSAAYRVLLSLIVWALVCQSLESAEIVCDSARVIVPAPVDTKLQHLAWPKVVKAQNGTLILAYSAGVGHNQGGSGLAVSLSQDHGKTFSPPHVLRYFPDDDPRFRDCGNMALGVAGDGGIVLLAMAFDGDQRNTILGWRSNDQGTSWTQTDTSTLSDNQTGSVFGHVLQVPGNRLAVCGHYRQPTGDGIWISYSDDHGVTWRAPQTITSEKYFEPAFTFAQQRLVGLVRENAAHAYHEFVSDDSGQTWTFHKNVIQGDQRAVHPSPFIVADPQNEGRLFALQTERTKDREIFLWSADIENLEWKRLRKLVSCPEAEDFGYPWMTHLKGGTWFVVFYAGEKSGPNSIHGMRLTIPNE